jgi:FkbM family methyltransferase
MTQTPTGERPAPGVGTLSVVLDGEAREFIYPEGADSEAYVRRVLAGTEYPLFTDAGWRPTSIVDIGANVGASALQFLATYPNAEVHCFEPGPEARACLSANLAGIGRAHAHPFGLSSAAERRLLYRGHHRHSQNSLYPGGEASHEGVEVEIRRAREVFLELDLAGCDILKIDTEGCEVPILTDLDSLIGETSVVCLEYHAEDDRLFIDRFLSPFFHLWSASCLGVHRGTNVYLSRALVERFPRVAFPEIRHRMGRPHPNSEKIEAA